MRWPWLFPLGSLISSAFLGQAAASNDWAPPWIEGVFIAFGALSQFVLGWFFGDERRRAGMRVSAP